MIPLSVRPDPLGAATAQSVKAPETTKDAQAPAKRWRRVLEAALVGALVVAAFAIGFVAEYSGDFHWHVVLGNWTIAHRAIYRHDTLSHTYPGAPMQVTAWLGDVLLAIGFRGGYPGVYALRGAALALAAWTLTRAFRRFGMGALGAVALVALWLSEGALRFFLRPEVLALAVFTLVLDRLFASLDEDRPLSAWPVVPLCALWANLHGSVNIGLLAVGLGMGELGLRLAVARRYRDAVACGGVLGASALAACASPEGVGTILVYRMLSAGCNAQLEWQPMHLTRLSLAAACLAIAAIVVCTAALAVAPRRVRLAPIALAIALAVLTSKHLRFQTVALLAAVFALASSTRPLRDRLARLPRPDLRRLALGTVAVTVLVGACATAADADLASELSLREAPSTYPTAACEFVRKSPPPGKLMNEFNIGSYLTWCLDGAAPVAIDQRVCSLYPGPFYTDYTERIRSAPTALADDLGASWAFVQHGVAARAMSREPDRWRLVYLDDEALVYARVDRPETRALASEVAGLAPWTLDALIVPTTAEEVEAGRRAVGRQIDRCPACDVTTLARAALAAGEGDAAELARRLGDLDAVADRDGRLARLPERLRLRSLLEARAAALAGDAARLRTQLFAYLAQGGDEGVAARAAAMAFTGGR